MRKKILITMHSMHIGGIETSLIGLLNAFDYSRVDVFLMIFQHRGQLMEHIPDDVHLLPYDFRYDVFEVPIKNILLSRNFFRGALKIASRIHLHFKCLLTRQTKGVWNKIQYTEKYLTPTFPRIPGNYDLCLAFSGEFSIAIKKVKAKTTVGWIHTDYNHLTPDPSIDRRHYSKLDWIVNVSDECRNVFLNYYPQFVDKAIVIENILPTTIIHQKSEKFSVGLEMRTVQNEHKLLSVGRFTHAKNFDTIPEMCRRLIDKGYKIRWYIIGYGGCRELIESKIKEFEVEEKVVILGGKANPYPYIRACDIYVQPSRYEGKAVTVREAQVLGKPVLITNFQTANSQLADGVDGIICPLSIDGVVDGIGKLLDDGNLRETLAATAATRDYSNHAEVEKIYEMMQ